MERQRDSMAFITRILEGYLMSHRRGLRCNGFSYDRGPAAYFRFEVVCSSGKYPQTLQVLLPEFVLGQHSRHGVPQDFLRLAAGHVGGGARFEPAGVPGVPSVHLALPLGAGQNHVLSVNDYHIVAAIHITNVGWFVLCVGTRECSQKCSARRELSGHGASSI